MENQVFTVQIGIQNLNQEEPEGVGVEDENLYRAVGTAFGNFICDQHGIPVGKLEQEIIDKYTDEIEKFLINSEKALLTVIENLQKSELESLPD